MTVAMEPVPVSDPEALRLAALAVDELHARFGPYGEPPLEECEFEPPGGAFLVARVDGAALGCGGIRSLANGLAEIKRLYVVPGARGRGLGKAIVMELEDRAMALGFARIVAETGMAAPEALAVYEARGFRRKACEPPLGGWVGAICVEKQFI